MEKKVACILFILILIAGGTLAGVFFLRSGERKAPTATGTETPTVTIARTTFSVTVADTDSERQQGLSGVPGLPEGAGKLFLFDVPGQPAFWMKDMRFSIDIVWIDAHWKVIDISEHLSPDTYPQTFAPRAPVRYVLEVPAGTVDSRGISIGDEVLFKP